MGGLGLRCAVDHAPVAHAVSLIAAQPLLDGLLGEDVDRGGRCLLFLNDAMFSNS